MTIKIFLLLTAVVQVWCQCKIPADAIVSLKHILAVQASKYRPLNILNEDTIAYGAILNLICGQNLTTTTCKGNEFRPSLNTIKPCDIPVKAELVKNKRDVEFNCIIYDISMPYYTSKKKQYLMLYRTCYDINSKTPVYTTYWAYPTQTRCKRPDAPFVAQPPAPRDANTRLVRQNVYKRFRELYGNDQTYHKPNEILINRGHLVPSSGYAFCGQQALTFDFINVVPQFKDINSGNWLRIEEYVRDTLARPGGVKVTTGAFGVLQLENKQRHKFIPLYLKDNKQLPVPAWTYKRIEGHNIVYLVYNSLLNIESVPKPKCGAINCNILLLPDQKGGRTYCCRAETFDQWLKNEMMKI